MSITYDWKFLVIIFPGGTGGNHLQNMISLCANFNSVFTSENYFKDLLEFYTNIGNSLDVKMKYVKFHPITQPNLTILNDLNYKQFIEKSNKKTVLIGHNHCLQDAIENKYFVNFEDTVFMVVNWPNTLNSIVGNRIRGGKFWPQHDKVYKLPYECPGSVPHFVVNYSNGFTCDPLKLFRSNGSKYLRKILAENLNLNLPKEADDLHDIWYRLQVKYHRFKDT